VGAFDLRECLLLQLARKEATSANLLARLILTEAFDEFSKKKFDKLISMFEISEEELKAANHEIAQLNPKPGNSVSSDSRENDAYEITPDFWVETNEDDISVSLNNGNIPALRVSNVYVRMFQDYSRDKANQTKDNKAAIQFVKQKLDNAKWFIEALHQRQMTLLSTMEAIVSYQRKFFITGDEADIRPMILKDIAEKTGLDISTLSRVSNSKYVQCNYGIFSLKYFFTDGIQNESGEEVSTREIKNMLKEAIQNEEKQKPLTDDRLCEMLNEKGYSLARRTVAKYRESLGIPVARLRKEME
jgi:RNA polymerase sigma-54 factor